jgi:ornithine cyclodeaminase/alanine dehydrogenase-like protein (mu-crystallin family)
MSWAIAADWLAVFGLVLLTFGTGAQAWANLAEFKSLRKAVSGLRR